MNKSSTKRLLVCVNGDLVGYFFKSNNGAHNFIYTKEWLSRKKAFPLSLSLPLRSDPYRGETVYNFFDNLLPDNPTVRAKIMARFQIPSSQPFDILEKIGRDAVGAIVLLSENSPSLADYFSWQRVDATPLDESSLARIFRGYRENAPLGMLHNEDDFRISLAGAQEKTALLYHKGNWHLPHKLTPTTHIIKMPIGEIHTARHVLDLRNSVDNELICLRLINALGARAAECEILQAEDIRVLAVKRFDRRFNRDKEYYERLLHEDFCQVFGLPPTMKYEADGGASIEQIMKTLLFADDLSDRRRFIQIQIIFWLLAAIDGHAKNFSIRIMEQGRYRLAPAYDVLSAYPMLGGRGWHESDIRLAMSLSGSKNGRKNRWNFISGRHFVATAKDCNFSTTILREDIADLCGRIPEAVNQVGNSLPKDIDETIRDKIFDGVQRAAEKLNKTN